MKTCALTFNYNCKDKKKKFNQMLNIPFQDKSIPFNRPKNRQRDYNYLSNWLQYAKIGKKKVITT